MAYTKLVALLFVLACFSGGIQGDCPTPFEVIATLPKCYYISTDTVASRNDAKVECESLGGYLASFEDLTEYSNLTNTIESSQEYTLDAYWTSGTYDTTDQEWVWEYSETSLLLLKFPMQYTQPFHHYMGPGEPNNPTTEPSIAIVMDGRDVNGYMYSEPDSLNLPSGVGYICETVPTPVSIK